MCVNGRRKPQPVVRNPGPCIPAQNPLVTHLLHHTAKKPRGKELEPRLTPLGHPWLQVPARSLSQRLLQICSLTSSASLTSYPRQAPGSTSTAIHSFCCQKSAQILEQSCWLGNPAFGITHFLWRGRDVTAWCHGPPAVANEEVPGSPEGWRATQDTVAILCSPQSSWHYRASEAVGVSSWCSDNTQGISEKE